MLNDNFLSELREVYKDITSDKSWVTALLLCLFGGCYGLHRFYTRKNKSAIIQLLLSISVIGLPVSIVWMYCDLFQILYNNFADSDDKMLDRNITRKSVALLTFFLGYLGFTDFYVKDYKKGLIKFLLFISCFGAFISIIWNLIDLHLICFSEKSANKYSGLKNNFDTKICLLLLLLSYIPLIILFCYVCQSPMQVANNINNAWVGLVTLIKSIIKWILKILFYCLCGVLAIAAIIGSMAGDSKTTNKEVKEKSNSKYQYAIVSYQHEGQIFSFKVNEIYESNLDKAIWVTDAKGFNKQAKFMSINQITFADYSRSTLPDYRLKKDFYKK